MEGPGRRAGVHDVLDPGRRGRRGGLDPLGNQAEWHGGLALQDAVEEPDQAEGNAQESTGGRFGRALGRGRGGGAARGCGPTELQRAEGVQGDTGHSEDEQHDEALVEERGVECGDDCAVVGPETCSHSWHDIRLLGSPGWRCAARCGAQQVVERACPLVPARTRNRGNGDEPVEWRPVTRCP